MDDNCTNGETIIICRPYSAIAFVGWANGHDHIAYGQSHIICPPYPT
ncbi:MAG: hypothetical protein F6K37_36245 [Moorea sp. SIO4E2]|nr:hypothetical protein [Moorena sp. SIO4E2]